jgi:hypothetical protein
VVQIDPKTMFAAQAYIGELQSLGVRVSIYLVGGHCEIGADCDQLGKGVRLGSTGSWNWDKTERRILDITHRTVLVRLAAGSITDGDWGRTTSASTTCIIPLARRIRARRRR